MIFQLLKHQFRAYYRSPSFDREIILQVLVGFLYLYILANAIVLAFSLPSLLGNVANDIVSLLHQTLFYYFIFELFIRYFIQSSPALDLEPYLHLPIKKSRISFYLQVKSVIHPINFLAALLTGPFAFKVIAPEYGIAGAWIWWLSIICISLTLHFFLLIFRKRWEDNLLVWVALIVLTAVNYLLSTYGVLNISTAFRSFFNIILEQQYLIVMPAILLLLVSFGSYKYYIDNLYIEDAGVGKSLGESYSSRLSFLSSYGITGALILQEIKLIVRHKRSRSFLILTFFFLFYGLIFLDDYTGGFSPILIFLGVFISGIFAFNYGQLLWSWKTNLLDFYFTRPFESKDIVKGLYQMLAVSCLICGLLSIPYVYFGWEVLVVYMACMLFNIGINVPLVMAISMWKPSAMDINKTAFFNYQGVGPAQWLMMVPVMGLPFLVYYLILWVSTPLVAIISLGIIGLIGTLCYKYSINYLTSRLQKQKYILVNNLRL